MDMDPVKRNSIYNTHLTYVQILLDDIEFGRGDWLYILQDDDGSHRLVYCVESPESWIEDVGKGTLAGGKAPITLDKDFGELAIRRSLPHCGIVRLVNISARQQGAVCRQVLAQYGDELTRGAIITVEAGRVRIRPPGDAGP